MKFQILLTRKMRKISSVCSDSHSDSSFVYGFMSLDYGFGTMTATTLSSDEFARSMVSVKQNANWYEDM